MHTYLSRLPRLIVGILTVSPVFGEPQRATIEYRPGVRLVVYQTSKPGNKPAPALIFAHGGSWVGGDFRSGIDLPLKIATDVGMVLFSVEYRLAAQHPFPAGLMDVERAVMYVRKHALKFGVDPDRIFLAGESAGGNLASLAAVRDNASLKVRGVIGFGAPQDLLSLSEWLRGLGVLPPELSAYLGTRGWSAGTEEKLKKASPLYQINSHAPSFLLVHGKSDVVVAPDQAAAMCRALQSCEVMLVEGAHAVSTWSVSAAEMDRMEEWLRARCRNPVAPNPSVRK